MNDSSFEMDEYLVVRRQMEALQVVALAAPKSFVRYCAENCGEGIFLCEGRAGFIQKIRYKSWHGPFHLRVGGIFRDIFLRGTVNLKAIQDRCAELNLDSGCNLLCQKRAPQDASLEECAGFSIGQEVDAWHVKSKSSRPLSHGSFTYQRDDGVTDVMLEMKYKLIEFEDCTVSIVKVNGMTSPLLDHNGMIYAIKATKDFSSQEEACKYAAKVINWCNKLYHGAYSKTANEKGSLSIDLKDGKCLEVSVAPAVIGRSNFTVRLELADRKILSKHNLNMRIPNGTISSKLSRRLKSEGTTI